MANQLKKKSAVNLAEYNNFIKIFAGYIKQNQEYVKNIVKTVKANVMVKDIWTDDYASQFANWFNDESGVSDGCDKLNKILKKEEALFKACCFAPIKEVVKLAGKDCLSENPYIKKAYNSSTMYELCGIKKYRKTDFGRLDTKRKNGWTVAADPTKLNEMNSVIETNIKNIKQLDERVKSLVKAKAISTSTQCVMIVGMNTQALNTTISDIETSAQKFETKATSFINNSVTNVNAAQTAIEGQATTITEED